MPLINSVTIFRKPIKWMIWVGEHYADNIKALGKKYPWRQPQCRCLFQYVTRTSVVL